MFFMILAQCVPRHAAAATRLRRRVLEQKRMEHDNCCDLWHQPTGPGDPLQYA